nr:DUF4827 domain-containing protein [Prevotella sp.]
MKKLLLSIIAIAALVTFAACDHNETYADQRNRELDSINAFLRNENVKVIKESEFEQRFEARKAGDKTIKLTDTDPNNNEYVLFESNGIYMQVIHDGCGNYIAKGKTQNVLCRYTEYCLANRAKICDDAITLTNDVPRFAIYTDEMSVKNTSGTFEGSFVDTNHSLLAQTYNSSYYGSVSATVPSGWLIPFSWIKIGRLITADDELAHVRLLVPHTYGTTSASASVYACLYDIRFQAAR